MDEGKGNGRLALAGESLPCVVALRHAAQRLGMTPNALRMRFARGTFPQRFLHRVGERLLFVRLDLLLAWIGEQPGYASPATANTSLRPCP